MEAKKIFTPSEKFVNQQFTKAIVAIIIGIILISTLGIGVILVFGVLFLVIAFMLNNKQMVKLYDKNIELSFAPIGSTLLIKYININRIEKVSDNKILIHYTNDGKDKRVRIPVHMFEPSDLKEFINVLENRKIG